MNSVLEGRPALKKEVEKIAEVAGYLWQNGWAERNGGNITVNVTDLVDDEIKALQAISDWYSFASIEGLLLLLQGYRQAYARLGSLAYGERFYHPNPRRLRQLCHHRR